MTDTTMSDQGVNTLGRWRALWALPLLFAATGGQALTIHYEPDREPELRICDDHRYRGRDDAAQACYSALLDGRIDVGSTNARLRADAAAALGDVRSANRLYREATRGNRDAVARTRWARLYLDTHQVSDAEALYREALLLEPTYLPARVGLADALSQSFEGRARESFREILDENPDNLHALVALARIELELQNLDDGRSLLDRALDAASEQDLPPLEMLALHAGAELLEDRPMTPWIERALEYNPRFGDVYAIPAHFYIITYRYREAVDLYRRAVELDDTLASAHRDLGINLLRINDVFGARHHLARAYELDPYDIQIVNTLRFLDTLDDMRVAWVDVPDPKDARRSLARVVIRLDREDADALEPYVVDLVIDAVQTFSERYAFRLARPMIVELFHDHDDFGVRTVSTPGIGLLGVTFGYLTAMDSPKARPAGDFHWGSTLWHEIAHVFTLEATNHRLPRWFSEGLSVYEEWNTGPLADRELSVETLTAIAEGRLLPLEQLDRGFVRPSYQGQVQVSYMQAGLTADFIATRWGHEALLTMLQAYARKESTATALAGATGLEPAEFDSLFREDLEVRFGELMATIDDYRGATRQLGQALELDDWISVEALARDLIRRYPERVGNGNAYEILAEAHRRHGDTDAAIETLLSWQSRGGHQPESLAELGMALRENGRDDDAATVYEALNWVMPYGTEGHAWLGDYYLEKGELARAVREFDALLGLQPDDPAAAWLGKARASVALEEPETAKRQVLFALESAPFFRPAQRLLLELVTGDSS